jgi:UDP-N-acetyl-D-mannosaminuronic acid dehydrogenase
MTINDETSVNGLHAHQSISHRGADGAWRVRRIVVVGAGIVGTPMAALFARARVMIGQTEPAEVVVVQRRSTTSGWKVDAINEGTSPVGGIEPGLDTIFRDAHAAGLLRASDDPLAARDADVVVVCVQTDKDGIGPAYGPLLDALETTATALEQRMARWPALVVIESTLAPSTMATVVRPLFARHGLIDGDRVLLGNSPNRVMPGRLVERVVTSPKLVAGMLPVTAERIAELYGRVVTGGALRTTSSLTAEVVKTLENAYRDVRIAYSAEVCRHCDGEDIDFYAVRDAVNTRLAQADTASVDPCAIPTGGLLVPTVGVGGHCLPKDGVLLWWRAQEAGFDTSHSIILGARRINDASPAYTHRLATRLHGDIRHCPVTILGVAYRPDSEDTRNSPSLVLASRLVERGCSVTLHDPYVRRGDPNVVRLGFARWLTRDLEGAIGDAHVVFACTAHTAYVSARQRIIAATRKSLVDACNLFRPEDVTVLGRRYLGVARGSRLPSETLVDDVYAGFRAIERGVANEVAMLCDFLNNRFAHTPEERVEFADVQRLAAECPTGCAIVGAGPVAARTFRSGFRSALVAAAVGGSDGRAAAEADAA